MIRHLHRTLFVVLGCLSVAIGVVGIFLPLLPTTPFLLLAAMCFSKGSERLHNWLLSHPHLGQVIIDWETYGVIRLKVKWLATISMCVLVSYPLIFMLEGIGLRVLVISTIVCVLIFIWTRPSEQVGAE